MKQRSWSVESARAIASGFSLACCAAAIPPSDAQLMRDKQRRRSARRRSGRPRQAWAWLLAPLVMAAPCLPSAAGADLYVDATNSAGITSGYAPSPFTVTSNSTYDSIYDGFANSGVVNHQSGNLTASSLYLGYRAGSSGAYNVLSDSSVLSTNSVYIGYRGTGNFTQSAGKVTVLGGFTLSLGYDVNSSGTYNLSGTGILQAGTVQIGYVSGTGSFMQSGGSAMLGSLFVGSFNSGSYSLSGGVLTSNLFIVGQGSTGNAVTGLFDQTGGTHTTGTVNIGANTANSKGTYNLSGGALAATSVVRGAGTGIFNFNGGTLQARGSDNPSAATNPTTFFAGLTTANVQAGGAKIDTNGFNVTVAQNLIHDPALVAAADGGLVKTGAGALTLTGANTYTGNTAVNAGTLLANNASGSATGTGQVSVSGATLGGKGIISGDVTAGQDGIISPGTSGTAGKLTLNSHLTLLAGSTFRIDLGGTAGTRVTINSLSTWPWRSAAAT